MGYGMIKMGWSQNGTDGQCRNDTGVRMIPNSTGIVFAGGYMGLICLM